MVFRLLLPLLLPVLAWAGDAADLARSLRETELDPAQCFRIRDLNLTRDEAQFYLTDGYLIFGKPVNGTPTTALFSGEVEGGDGEVLLLPPNRSERRSLAAHTESPNLDEHFTTALFIFSEDTYRELFEEIAKNPYNKKSGEMGALLAEKWTPVARNIAPSFSLRVLLDMLSPPASRRGYFAAAISGNQLGSFDLAFDSRSAEQLLLGASLTRENRTFFDVWASFTSKSFRGKRPEPEFRLSDYRIDTTFDADLRMHCITRVKVEPRGAAGRALPFDITRQMTITAATIDGQPLEILRNESVRPISQNDLGASSFLAVSPEALQPGRQYELEFRHEGKVVSDAGNQVYYVGARGSWYPNRGTQFAQYDLTFRSPKQLDLVASGDLVEDEVRGNHRVTRRITSAPIRLAGFNLGVYQRAKIARPAFTVEVCANQSVETALRPRAPDLTWTPPSVPLPRQPRRMRDSSEVFEPAQPVPPPSSTARLQSLALEIADIMDFYSRHFGPPALKTVEVSPVPGRFGQGFAGMIYLSTLSYLRPTERAISGMDERGKIFFSDLLHAHEAAHQWWGNVVTSAGYHDEWLMEALANYSALLYMEKKKGSRATEVVLEDYRRRLLLKRENGDTVESAGPVVQGTRLELAAGPEAWTTIIYGKGTWIIHMLRRRMGDETFLKMLAELRRQYQDKPITTEEFRALCAGFLPAKSLDPKLESFFDQWIYGTGIPTLKLAYSVKGKLPALNVTGTVTQTGVEEDFTADVPIEIQFGRAKNVIQLVRASSDPNPFSIPVRASPTKVVVDQHAILHR